VIVVDPGKEDLEYYIESCDDPDYIYMQQAYDEDFFSEALGSDELQVVNVNVDHVTQAEIVMCVSDENKGKDKKGGKGGRYRYGDNTNYESI